MQAPARTMFDERQEAPSGSQFSRKVGRPGATPNRDAHSWCHRNDGNLARCRTRIGSRRRPRGQTGGCRVFSRRQRYCRHRRRRQVMPAAGLAVPRRRLWPWQAPCRRATGARQQYRPRPTIARQPTDVPGGARQGGDAVLVAVPSCSLMGGVAFDHHLASRRAIHFVPGKWSAAITQAAVRGTASNAPAKPHIQVQNASATTIAKGDRDRLWPCSAG